MTLKDDCTRIAKELGYIFVEKGNYRSDMAGTEKYYWLFRGKIGNPFGRWRFDNLLQVHFYLLSTSPKHYNEYMANDAKRGKKKK
jgi:hypothetical protein